LAICRFTNKIQLSLPPLDFLAELQEKLEGVIEWNSTKHIATSERVDHPKIKRQKAFCSSTSFAAI
jgi:hypothetical protein